MTQNLNNKEIVESMQKAFSEHKDNHSDKPFSPDPKLNSAFSVLTRELEIRRQVGDLTESEKDMLKNIDGLISDIADYNEQIKKQPADNQIGEKVYNIASKVVQEEQSTHQNPDIPQISTEEAEDIIEHLNKQFTEKVMNPVNKERKQKAEADSDEDQNPADLKSFLSEVRTERPDKPFADEDSDFDLAKLTQTSDGKSE